MIVPTNIEGTQRPNSQIDMSSKSDTSEIVRLLMTRLDRKHHMKLVSNPLLRAPLQTNLLIWVKLDIQMM